MDLTRISEEGVKAIRGLHQLLREVDEEAVRALQL
jgi:hypothetical protein